MFNRGIRTKVGHKCRQSLYPKPIILFRFKERKLYLISELK